MKKIKKYLYVSAFVIVAYYLGAMFSFLPFHTYDITTDAMAYCTLIICNVLVWCTFYLKNNSK